MSWIPVSSAPFDRGLELAFIDHSGTHTIVFPCRRIVGGWMDAKTKRRLEIELTHWREWKQESRRRRAPLVDIEQTGLQIHMTFDH